MNNQNSNSEQSNQTAIPSSLRLALTASILTTIADGIATLAALAAIDELKIDMEKEKQDQKDLDEKFRKLQVQIDTLTTELRRMRYRNIK